MWKVEREMRGRERRGEGMVGGEGMSFICWLTP